MSRDARSCGHVQVRRAQTAAPKAAPDAPRPGRLRQTRALGGRRARCGPRHGDRCRAVVGCRAVGGLGRLDGDAEHRSRDLARRRHAGGAIAGTCRPIHFDRAPLTAGGAISPARLSKCQIFRYLGFGANWHPALKQVRPNSQSSPARLMVNRTPYFGLALDTVLRVGLDPRPFTNHPLGGEDVTMLQAADDDCGDQTPNAAMAAASQPPDSARPCTPPYAATGTSGYDQNSYPTSNGQARRVGVGLADARPSSTAGSPWSGHEAIERHLRRPRP